MKCESLQFNLSLYADDILTEDERAAADRHLVQCPLCRQKLDDYAAIRQSLRRVTQPAIPKDLLASVKQSMRAELEPATPRRSAFFSQAFWEFLQMRVMPYTVGAAASVFLGFTMLWALLSTANYPPDEFVAAKRSDISIPRIPTGNEISVADFIAQRGLVSNESPSLNPQGALLEITNAFVSGRVKEEELVVIADVRGDGLASIEEVVAPLDDQKTVFELERAMNKNSTDAPFVPAFLDRRADSVRVVLRIQRVEVKDSQPDAKR
jgi:hypothetical protein